jgi:hypothetical protein
MVRSLAAMRMMTATCLDEVLLQLVVTCFKLIVLLTVFVAV